MNTMALTESSTAMVSAFTAIAGDVTTAIGGIAPVAIGVMGVMLIWRIGTKFFKQTAK